MPQPTEYQPETAFWSFEAGQSWFPGHQLDAEFVNLDITLTEILANLALIQRDDGEVANKTIGVDQLTDDLWATINSLTANNAQAISDALAFKADLSFVNSTFTTKANNLSDLVDREAATNNLKFLQAGTGAVQRTVRDKLRDVVSVKDFGAVGNNVVDDTAAIQAAIAAAIAAGKALYLPAGTYKISGGLSITAPLDLWGDGPRRTIIRQTNGSANVLIFDYPTLLIGGGVHNMSIEAGSGWLTAGFQGSGTTGVGIALFNVLTNFVIENFQIANCDYGITIDSTVGNLGSWGIHIKNFQILYFTTFGIRIAANGDAGGDRFIHDGAISNNGFTGTNTGSVAIRWYQSGGDFMRDVDITSSAWGVVVDPDTAKQVAYLFFDGVVADTCINENWLFTALNGAIVGIVCVNCWGAFSTNSAGLLTRSTGTNLDGLTWVGGRLRENGKEGWSHQGGINVHVDSTQIAKNSQLTNNTYAGVQVAANISQWAVTNCRVGNFASGLGNTQADGINIAAGTSTNFRIENNDLNNMGAGKAGFANGATGTLTQIGGNLPLVSNGSTPTTIASASTVDLGSTSASEISVSGTTTITAFGGNAGLGERKQVTFQGALTLTHNATSLILPGGVNITTAAGDTLEAIHEGSGNWRVVTYTEGDLPAIAAFTSTGLAARTGTNAWAQRTITAGVGATVTNGSGAGGNPTIATGITLFGTTLAGGVAAGATTFLGPNGNNATENLARYIVAEARTATTVVVGVSAAPGVGQTFTYTLRKGGVDTGITGTISGAGQFAATLTGSVAYTATDTLTLKLVTSAGAAVTDHTWSIVLAG